MAVGLVFYIDEPNRVFRKVFLSPGDTDREFWDPRWVTEGCDPSKIAMCVVVSDAEAARVSLESA